MSEEYSIEGWCRLHTSSGFCEYFLPKILDIDSFVMKKDNGQVIIETPQKRVSILFKDDFYHKISYQENSKEFEHCFSQKNPFVISANAKNMERFLRDEIDLLRLKFTYPEPPL